MASNGEEQGSKRVRTDTRTGVYYGDYLQLPKLLSCVQPESLKSGKVAHDEHLFIVIHQVYELWFKQILYELDSIIDIFSQTSVDDRKMLVVINRMKRIVEIQKVLVDQVKILETMDAMEFMDFRHLLVPASGFQSVQFRVLENKLGLQMQDRSQYQQKVYKGYFAENEVIALEASENSSSLLKLVEKWLERTPGLNQGDYSFEREYAGAVSSMLETLRNEQASDPSLSEADKQALTESWEKNKSMFASILDPKEHDSLISEGVRKFSHRAFMGALMIYMYRDEPMYNLPFQLLSLLTDIDVNIIRWRHQHLQMVQRMIGSKIGTGGSSGYQYLRTTITDKYKIFLDLFGLPTFVLPRRFVPPLPPHLSATLGYGGAK